MATEATRLARRLYELVEAGRTDQLPEIVAEDFVGHGAGAGGGADALVQDLSTWTSAFSDARFNISRTVAEGDTVALHMTIRGTHTGPFAGVPATGRAIEIAGTDVWRAENGKLAECWTLCDMATLFLQLGVRQAPATAEV